MASCSLESTRRSYASSFIPINFTATKYLQRKMFKQSPQQCFFINFVLVVAHDVNLFFSTLFLCSDAV